MKIVFDTDTCKKEGKDIDLMLYLISVYAGAKITANTFEKARQQRLIDFEKMYEPDKPFPEYISLNSTGEFVVEGIMASSDTTNIPSDRFTDLANKLRELFPSGKKPGYAYTWRDSTSCIADRLKKFTLKYGNYSDEAIIEATKKYVSSFNGDYKFMQLLKYFIWKNKITGEEMQNGRLVGEVEKQSQLAAYLEDTEDTTLGSDWDVKLK